MDINDARILETERNIWKEFIAAAQTTKCKVATVVLLKYSSSVNVFPVRAKNLDNQ